MRRRKSPAPATASRANANQPTCGSNAVTPATPKTALPKKLPAHSRGPNPVNAPSPPAMVAAATKGADSTLASGDHRGRPPTANSKTGATAACAPHDAPSEVPSQRGFTAGNQPEPITTPAVAATDSINPRLNPNSGEINNSKPTPAPITFQMLGSKPKGTATNIRPAITAARNTDGSGPISNTKNTNPAKPKTARRRELHPNGPAARNKAPKNRATLLPDTAT